MSMASVTRALWNYRGFVVSSVMREFNGKYRESLLGAFWSIANPLTMIFIYTVVFGQIMRPMLPGNEKLPYAFGIYLCAGVIPWLLFAEMLQRLNTVFIDNANLIKKSNFPRTCLPTVVALSALINFAIVLGIFLLFLAIIDHWPGWALLAAFPLIGLQILFTLGLGVFLGTLNVFFRDIGQITGVALQFWFWLTPIVYTLSALPDSARVLIAFNPLQPLISAYRQIFLERLTPDWFSLLPLALITLFFLVLGARFFLVHVGELVDEL